MEKTICVFNVNMDGNIIMNIELFGASVLVDFEFLRNDIAMFGILDPPNILSNCKLE